MFRHALNLPLVELIGYLLKCLAYERRDSVNVPKNLLERTLFPAADSTQTSWASLTGTSTAAAIVEQIQGRSNRTVLYAPMLMANSQSQVEPLIGIFGVVSNRQLRLDPADIWIGSVLSDEVDEETLNLMRAEIERSARKTPKALEEAILHVLQREGLPFPQPCTDFNQIRSLSPESLARFPAFWVVESEAEYDRGLTRELRKLRTLIKDTDAWYGTALRCLVAPPTPMPIDPLELAMVMSNPARPTFRQAKAIAYALNQPITVVTGPPGTGKTHMVATLIIEQLCRGRSVLVASKINTAVNSAVQLINRLVGEGAILRTGNLEAREQLVRLATTLASWQRWQSSGELGRSAPAPTQDWGDFVNQLDRVLFRNHCAVQTLRRRARTLQHSGNQPLRWWQWLRRRHLAQFRNAWKTLNQETESLLSSLQNGSAIRLAELYSALDRLIRRTAPDLAQLATAYEKDSRALHRLLGQLARKGYPIAVSNFAISTNLPLEPALFDMLIIDEASTCDPASLLPLLYRARRAVIIGDPQQLPHVTGAGWRQVSPVPTLTSVSRTTFRVEFRMSAYELCRYLVGGEAHCLLQDHFRCPPKIISFANAQFYGGQLRIYTPDQNDCLEVRFVESRQHTTRTGSRRNPAQEESAYDTLKTLVALHPHATYGIVTPYRAAADSLLQRVSSDPELKPLLQSGALLVGTAHRFQGYEVDYLVFATIAGANATEHERRWVEHPHLFNVAITRARRKLVLIVDHYLWKQEALPLIAKLMQTDAVICEADTQQLPQVIEEMSQFLNAHQIPHLTNATYRGYPFEILDANYPPQWAINLLSWPEMQKVDLLEAMRLYLEDAQLYRFGLKIVYASPLDWKLHIAEWLATREIDS